MSQAVNELADKQAKLIDHLSSGTYKSLAGVIQNGVGRSIQRLTRTPQPPTIIYNAVVILLLILISGSLVSYFLNETVTPEMLLIGLWGGVLGGMVMLQAQHGFRLLFDTLKESTIPAIQSADNLAALRRWLDTTFELKRQMLFSVVMSIGVGVIAPILWAVLRGGFPGYGPMVGVILIWFQAGMGWYSIGPMLAWLSQLGSYQLKLYEVDPSHSEVIDRLADVLNFLVFSGSVLAALFTLGLMYFELLNPTVALVFLVLGTWGPLITIFLSSQYVLARIISRTKWQKLGEIQAKIETLNAEQDLANKDTIESINRLIDYHNRILETRDTALNLRAGLNFLNSLLLPLLAFILGNLDDVLAYF